MKTDLPLCFLISHRSRLQDATALVSRAKLLIDPDGVTDFNMCVSSWIQGMLYLIVNQGGACPE